MEFTANGSAVISGRLEICINGEWAALCDDETLSDRLADVACNSISYQYNSKFVPLLSFSPTSSLFSYSSPSSLFTFFSISLSLSIFLSYLPLSLSFMLSVPSRDFCLSPL